MQNFSEKTSKLHLYHQARDYLLRHDLVAPARCHYSGKELLRYIESGITAMERYVWTTKEKKTRRPQVGSFQHELENPELALTQEEIDELYS